MSKESDLAVLEKSPIFHHLPRPLLERLYHAGFTRRVEAGEAVVIQDEPSPGLCVILEGSFGVDIQNHLQYPTGRIVELGPGDGFGELSLFDGGPASATVRSLSPARLFIIPYDVLRDFMSSESRVERIVLWNLGNVLAHRLRETNTGLNLIRKILIRTLQSVQRDSEND